jgi:hypothetical protein
MSLLLSLCFHRIRTYDYFGDVGSLVVAKKLDRPSAEFFYVYTSSKEEQVSTVVEYDALDDVFDPFDEYFNRYYFYN